jgi:small subunit ribosomal protein S13
MADFKHIIRIANTDLNGQKKLVYALQKIKGVGVPFGHAVCSVLQLDENRRLGDLGEAECKRIEEVVLAPGKFGIPSWVLNRRRDHETGEDRHVVGNELAFSLESDVRLMKKIKCYRGVRHILHLPVRGQRMRSKHRKNKGKVLGVKKPKMGKKQ